jgi:hypothetical protein
MCTSTHRDQLSNVSLQLTGDCGKEVVLGTRLAPLVRQLHLPS